MNGYTPTANITLYGIPNCATVKKARAWLDTHAIAHTFYNFKKDGVTPAMIESWLKNCDWEVLLNHKGTTWRALSEERKTAIIDAPSAIALMCESPSAIKRPVLTIGNAATQKSHVGFSDALYQQIFKI
ncbi:MAG: ArsC family reductase [Burkholderiaceae bacterium]